MKKDFDFKPKKIRFDTIREIAEIKRGEFCNPPDIIPVPIEEIVEFKLKIEIIPKFGLQSNNIVEAFLSNDLKTMYVDSSIYMDDRYIKRLRFTFAHELGHLFLHGDIFKNLEFHDYEDWIDFIRRIDPDDYDWFESQANEFAGRFLVPKESLLKNVSLLESQLKSYIQKCKETKDEIDKDYILLGISRKICDKFQVSAEVVRRRIKNERIIEELNLEELFS
jgi:hypothetical protein